MDQLICYCLICIHCHFSLSPTEQAPLSLTDRYLSDYKKRLLEMENWKGEMNNANSGSDLEVRQIMCVRLYNVCNIMDAD